MPGGNVGNPLSPSGQFDQAIVRPNNILNSLRGLIEEVGGVSFAAGQRETPAGALLALDSTTGFFIENESTELAVAGADMDTVITVDNARAFDVGDDITVVGESATTVSAIDYALNTITLADALTATRAIDVRVFNATDNRGTALGVLMDTVNGVNSARGSIPDPLQVFAVPMAHEGMFNRTIMVTEGLDAQARTDLNADDIGSDAVRIRGVGSAT